MSIETNINNVLAEIMKLLTQKEEVIKKINHNQKKLDSLFDALGKDSIKIEMGDLKRVKDGKESKWIIEITA